jgi:transposase
LARLLPTKGIRTIVFDPASFLRPRRARIAKTDRLDAEDMIRTLRAWLSGDASVAREVRVPSIEEEDAKRLTRERKHLVNERTRLIGRIKSLCALQGVRVRKHMISKRWAKTLDQQLTGEGKEIPPFLRRELHRLLRRYEFLAGLLREVESEAAKAVSDPESPFPQKAKVALLARLAGVGQSSAAMLVAEVFVRKFENRRHLSSFLGLAPTPHASGDISRNKGISKAGCKLARSTLVELAWSWLRYQHDSALASWWRARFSKRGVRIRNIGIVALARKLVVAFWQFVEDGQVPEGALLKA